MVKIDKILFPSELREYSLKVIKDWSKPSLAA